MNEQTWQEYCNRVRKLEKRVNALEQEPKVTTTSTDEPMVIQYPQTDKPMVMQYPQVDGITPTVVKKKPTLDDLWANIKKWKEEAEQEPTDDATLKDIFCMGCEYKEQEPCTDAQERYEDLCEYFGDARDILKSRKDFKAWLDRIKWHIHKAEELYEKYEHKQESKWIPVSERLPESDIEVLVTDDAGGLATIRTDSIYESEVTGEKDWYISQNVTAWMPLPEPYK